MSKFYNRELSWLGFNYRVLSEAKDKSIPLMERLKFLGITASNLDEFFMIRVASLKDMVHAKYTKKDIAGLTPREQLETISQGTHELVESQYNIYNRSFLPTLKRQGLKIITQYENLTKEQAAYVDNYFLKEVYPVLTPMSVDSQQIPEHRGASDGQKAERHLRFCHSSGSLRTAKNRNRALGKRRGNSDPSAGAGD